MATEYDYFQLNPTSTTDMGETIGPGVTTRNLNMKMSNFGALNFGSRMSTDYTRTDLDYEEKSTYENKVPSWLYAERNENPFVSGSTVKKILDDQAWRMGMENETNGAVNKPGFDVSDTNVILGSMTKGKNYPSEGWRSFGGKYDFAEVYSGIVR